MKIIKPDVQFITPIDGGHHSISTHAPLAGRDPDRPQEGH